jgi:xanthine dehydrogenase accessory factor
MHRGITAANEIGEAVTQKIMDKISTTSWVKPIVMTIEDLCGGKYRVFWDRVVKKSRAVIFGGGHISQPLVQILALLDFEVTVVDDRPEFANQTRFPNAYNVICESFQKALREIVIDEESVVILVTRGHRYDLECLRVTMYCNARYLGMIGSRKRVKEMISLIQKEGGPADLSQRIRAPIGLDINAETPAEIAVSIAAEVISAIRGGTCRPLSEKREAF